MRHGKPQETFLESNSGNNDTHRGAKVSFLQGMEHGSLFACGKRSWLHLGRAPQTNCASLKAARSAVLHVQARRRPQSLSFQTGKATGSHMKQQAELYLFLACLPNTSQHYMVPYKCPALHKSLTTPKRKAKFAEGWHMTNPSPFFLLQPCLAARRKLFSRKNITKKDLLTSGQRSAARSRTHILQANSTPHLQKVVDAASVKKNHLVCACSMASKRNPIPKTNPQGTS